MMVKYLLDNGMFDSQAKLVMEMVRDSELFIEMRGRLDEETTAYPEVFKNLCIMNLKAVAVEYIDTNCPKAWFRTVFLPESEQRKVVPEAFADVEEGEQLAECAEATTKRSTTSPSTFDMPYGQVQVKALVTHFGMKKDEVYTATPVVGHDDCWSVDLDGFQSDIAKKHFSDPIE